MSMRKLFLALVLVTILGLFVVGFDNDVAFAQGPGGNSGHGRGMGNGWHNPGNTSQGSWGGHMMGGGVMQDNTSAYGNSMWGNHPMMDGYYNHAGCPSCGSMWIGSNMMGATGPWTPPTSLSPTTNALALDEAMSISQAYITSWGDENLALGDVVQFDNHFYAQAVEASSGRSAFEVLVDPHTGSVFPEPGPNMMWNLRYGMSANQGAGMMGHWEIPAGVDGVEMPVSSVQAQQYAQTFLDTFYPEMDISEGSDAFYGYYTLHILQDETIVGMLSVNGYTGQVWLHDWHGQFISKTEAPQ